MIYSPINVDIMHCIFLYFSRTQYFSVDRRSLVRIFVYIKHFLSLLCWSKSYVNLVTWLFLSTFWSQIFYFVKCCWLDLIVNKVFIRKVKKYSSSSSSSSSSTSSSSSSDSAFEFIECYTGWPRNKGTVGAVDFSGLWSNQQ